jgi:hypothetical protein
VRIEPGSDPVVVIGSIDVVLHVLLAGPDHFHRPLDLLGDAHRQGLDVKLEPAAEPAA